MLYKYKERKKKKITNKIHKGGLSLAGGGGGGGGYIVTHDSVFTYVHGTCVCIRVTCAHTHMHTQTHHRHTNCCKHIHMPAVRVCACEYVCVRVHMSQHTRTSYTLHLRKCTCPHRVCMYMCTLCACVYSHAHYTRYMQYP